MRVTSKAFDYKTDTLTPFSLMHCELVVLSGSVLAEVSSPFFHSSALRLKIHPSDTASLK